MLLPREARAHLPSRATPEEHARLLADIAVQAPPLLAQLDRRLTDPVAEWLASGARRYSSVRVVGFQDQYKIRLSLHDIFVALSVQPGSRGELRAVTGKERGDGDDALRAEQPRKASLDEALEYAGTLPETAGIVLLGDPGAGKTTLLHHLYTRTAIAGSRSMGLPEGLCPVYVRCSSLTDADRKPGGLRGVLLRQAEIDGKAAAGRQVLDEGRKVLFLLDGLDEVRDRQTRARVCEWLGEEVVAHWPGSRFVVTCRTQAFRDEARLDSQFVRVEVEWLDERRVRTFVERWFRAVHAQLGEPERAETEAEALLAVVLDPKRLQNIRLREMTQNPLLLSTLCLLHRSNLRLPEKRGELYDRCISLLLETWAERAERPSLPDRPARLVLQPLAYAMHARAARELEVEEAERIVAAPLARVPALAKMTPAAFLEVACEQCGVLASRNIGSYELFHLSFQEYLCAAYMKEAGLAGELASHAGDPWWHEVILLAMSMPGMFGGVVRELVALGKIAEQMGLVRECMEEAIEIDEGPFVEVLDAAVAQMARPKRGLGAWWARTFGPVEQDTTPAVRAVLTVAQGRELAGVQERAAKLVEHEDAGVSAAARALVGGPVVEQGTEPAATDRRWREPIDGDDVRVGAAGQVPDGGDDGSGGAGVRSRRVPPRSAAPRGGAAARGVDGGASGHERRVRRVPRRARPGRAEAAHGTARGRRARVVRAGGYASGARILAEQALQRACAARGRRRLRRGARVLRVAHEACGIAGWPRLRPAHGGRVGARGAGRGRT